MLKKDLHVLYTLWKDRAPIDVGKVNVGGVDVGGAGAPGAVLNSNANANDEESDNEIMNPEDGFKSEVI